MNDFSDLQITLLEQLPPWYRDVLDYQQLCQSEQTELDALAQAIVSVADNLFFQTMDEGTATQWEQIFGIVANTATETLAFRRARILNRVSIRPPFTLGFLHQKLDELIGPGEWTVTVDYPNYTLYIESSAENQSYATEVAYTIGKIKPAHIVYVNTPYVRSGILASETISLSQMVYNYRLGSWGLGVLPFAYENDQGVIKMPTAPSIQTALLEGIANFVSGDVASARVNGSVAIADINKHVDGSTLTVTYSVSASQAAEINLIELLDSTGTVLTSSTVYIPVTSSTILKHTIPVAEGVTGNGQ